MSELSEALWNSLAASLWRASWQGGLLIAVLFLIQRLVPGLSPRVRAVGWWAASLKLLLGLFPLKGLIFTLAVADVGLAPPRFAPVVAHTARSAQNAAAALGARDLPWTALLGAVWLVGFAVAVERLIRGRDRIRALVASATPVFEPQVLAIRDAVCARAGLKTRPEVWSSPDARSPFVTGLKAPRIVLPANALTHLGSAELKMALAHEAAHLRRRDLIWGWGPALAELVFWFLPLSWLAAREYAQAREESCDAAALRLEGAAPDAYARLLLEFGTARNSVPVTAACAASPHFRHLRRRLHLLGQPLRSPGRARLIASGAVAAFALVPMRLATAWEPPAPPATPGVAHASLGRESPRDLSYMLAVGDSMTVSASRADIERLSGLRSRYGEKFLWVQHGGQAYVIRDEHALAPLLALREQMNELGEQQSSLGAEQSKLGARQSELGRQQSLLGMRQSDFGREQSKVAADQAKASCDEQRDLLGRRQDALSRHQDELAAQQDVLASKQDALGREQDALGSKQGVLGQQQEQMGQQFEQRLPAVLADALARGSATIVPSSH